jgi:hypothetical protein
MSRPLDSFLPSDISLLLRADAEQNWLHREVLPVLRHLEEPEQIPEEEVGAALETDEAHGCLREHSEHGETLAGPAEHYHAAVKVLRGIVAKRVTPFVKPSPELDGCDKETEDVLHLKGTRSNGRAPRAA